MTYIARENETPAVEGIIEYDIFIVEDAEGVDGEIVPIKKFVETKSKEFYQELKNKYLAQIADVDEKLKAIENI